MLFTPLMINGGPIGMISVTRKDPGAFVADEPGFRRPSPIRR